MIETDIFNYSTPEFFINMKSTPDKMSAEREAFVKEERRKCREGININGVPIVGELYTHLNYYKLMKDLPSGKKEVGLPDFRDADWIIFNDYAQAKLEKKIYTLFGLRQIGKSEIETSLCLRELSLYRDTEALALFASKTDKDTFVKKIRNCITHGEKFIYRPNIDQDWDKGEIRFGITKTDNTHDLTGMLYIYLTQDGRRIQVGSGKTPSFFLMDEIAKSDFRLVYEAVEPALLSDFGGLRCAPMFAFTGGEVEKAADAEKLVKYPSDKRQLVFDHEGTKIGGRFLSGLYRKDCRVDSTFSEMVGKKTGTWLDEYPVRVSDFNKAEKLIEEELEEARKNPDPATVILKRIFFPLSLDDVFLTQGKNPFDIEGLKRHKEYLLANPVLKAKVELYRDNVGKVSYVFSDKELIPEYPTPSGSFDLDAPIAIYDFPKYIKDGGNYALHVIGFDPINQDISDTESLASIYIMRRNHTDIDDPFRNKCVASWTTRPRKNKDFLDKVRLLQEFYNAQILHEDSGNGVTLYFDTHRKSDVLMSTFSLQRAINPKSAANTTKGLKAIPTNNSVRLEVLRNYMEEELEDGQPGYTRIPDPVLIDELIKFDGMGKGTRNTDRIDGFSYAVLQCTTLEKYNNTRPYITHTEETKKVEKKFVARDAMGIINKRMSYYKRRV